MTLSETKFFWTNTSEPLATTVFKSNLDGDSIQINIETYDKTSLCNSDQYTLSKGLAQTVFVKCGDSFTLEGQALWTDNIVTFRGVMIKGDLFNVQIQPMCIAVI